MKTANLHPSLASFGKSTIELTPKDQAFLVRHAVTKELVDLAFRQANRAHRKGYNHHRPGSREGILAAVSEVLSEDLPKEPELDNLITAIAARAEEIAVPLLPAAALHPALAPFGQDQPTLRPQDVEYLRRHGPLASAELVAKAMQKAGGSYQKNRGKTQVDRFVRAEEAALEVLARTLPMAHALENLSWAIAKHVAESEHLKQSFGAEGKEGAPAEDEEEAEPSLCA